MGCFDERNDWRDDAGKECLNRFLDGRRKGGGLSGVVSLGDDIELLKMRDDHGENSQTLVVVDYKEYSWHRLFALQI